MPGVTHLTNQSKFVQADATFHGTNISGTIVSNNISLSVAAGGGGADGYNILAAGTQTANTTGTVAFVNGNGITFGMSNSSQITASYNSTQFQSTGNYLTTARASTDAIGLNTALTANGVSMTANSSGLSLNFPAFLTTAQPVGAYLTTARLSNDGVGLNTAQSNVTWTVNSNGISLNANGYAGTGFATTTTNGSVVVGTNATNGITLAVPAYLTTAQAPGAYLTTAAQSNQVVNSFNGSTGQISVNVGSSISSSTNGSSITFGLASNITTALQSAGAYLTTAALSNHSHNFATTTTNGASIIVATTNSNGATIAVPAFLTTAQPVGAYLTTARASNDAVGLNTAQSNVTWTVNSSGISLDARGYAGTGTSATNASVTLNSNGIAISVGAGGGVTPFASASNGSFSFTTLGFSNANNVTFGTSAGSIITASVAAPGAAAENNWVNLLGANTAGNTTASGSTIGYSGINLTLSGTNGSVVNISAPATSSLVGINGISLSTNGSTISVSRVNPYLSRYIHPLPTLLTGLGAFGNGSMSIRYVPNCGYITATRLDALVSWSASSSATANTAAIALTAFAGIYTRNGSTLQSVSSATTQTTYSYASNTSNYTGINSAVRAVSVPMNINMTPGEYFVGFGFSTAASSVGTATTNLAQTVSAMGFVGLQSALNYAEFGSATNNTVGLYSGMGIYSAALSTVPPTISLSAINQTGTNLSRANIALVFRNY